MPFEHSSEHELSVNRGWNSASAVRVVTTVDGVHVAFYSLHISGWKEAKRNDTHAYQLTTGVSQVATELGFCAVLVPPSSKTLSLL